MIKLATYNINGIRPRLPNLIEWLRREKPDVVCLQELKAPDAEFPKNTLRAEGYGAIWHGQAAWNGVAILARGADPVELRRGLPGDPKDLQSRYLEADVQGLRVGCLYLPNGKPQPGAKFDYKIAWFERLIAHAAKLRRQKTPFILAGDFNVVPTDEDIYNAKSWLRDALLQPETRECYRRLLKQGWLDALQAKNLDGAVYTFWDYFRNHWKRDAGLRIDHLLLHPSLAEHFEDAGVDRWVRGRPHASDHAPVWVVLGKPKRKSAARPRRLAAGRKRNSPRKSMNRPRA